MNLPADEMLRLARKTYPGQKVEARDHRVYVRPPHGEKALPDMVLFSPSLTGEDWQKAQALDCIVAAENSPQHQQYRDHVANGMPSFQAAISALLANSSAGGKP